MRSWVLVTLTLAACRLDYAGSDDPCGDGVVELGETCDDSNASDGDGCSAACELETQGPGSSDCTNPPPLFLSPTGALTMGALVSGDTSDDLDVFEPSCESSVAPQEIFTFEIAEVADLVIVGSSTAYDMVLSVRGDGGRGCVDPAGELACATTVGATEELSVPAISPGRYYLLVDGDEVESGPFTLQISTTAATAPE